MRSVWCIHRAASNAGANVTHTVHKSVSVRALTVSRVGSTQNWVDPTDAGPVTNTSCDDTEGMEYLNIAE